MAQQYRPWTEEELVTLRDLHGQRWSRKRIAGHLGRSPESVASALARLRRSADQRERQAERKRLYAEALARLRAAHPRVWRRLFEQTRAAAGPAQTYNDSYSRAGTRLRQRYPREYAAIVDAVRAERRTLDR